ncbi:protein-glutamate methylesterase/protein-glutamine glutaminase [Paragemmobacter straminiformis]|uniref:Protein-glutamate methylesterase/protein-glutamine glutaminase n=1 Tax=Paragemmobacter straminiformis TaxID=2045119 RepID=A0A842I5Y0_9RHOB|nr:chemotaxis response regulator protein-glutamate methylesterase [Gemmobacter straminiformis]MBC2834787.1 chemotaxis response regulator protein-glutamate methylesterase [Gemmobacter straminiformis]
MVRSSAPRVVKVLIVDDSAMVRKVLTMGLSSDRFIQVVGAASNPDTAWKMIQDLRPDVITLDVEMPEMDGISFLRAFLPKARIPTVMISAHTRDGAQTSIDAMEAGAVDIIPKPALAGLASGLPAMMADICARVRAAADAHVMLGRTHPSAPRAPLAARPSAPRAPRAAAGPEILALGSSTGGVQALGAILPMFPADCPPIVIVQHMPEAFTGPFANRLDGTCTVTVREAQDGDTVEPGCVLIAPGGKRHMEIVPNGRGYRIRLVEGPAVCFSRPSVDVLFNSVARLAGPNAVAAILTGMGRDGSAGLLAIRQAGGRTLAQDEETSVVYGMPMAAWENGAAEVALPLEDIPARMLAMLAQRPHRTELRA